MAVSNTGARGATNSAQSQDSPTGHIFTVADVAAKLDLTEQPNGKWQGAPKGTGKTKDGFVLCPDGNAFTNGDGPNYNWEQVAELAGISPDQYEPYVEFRAGKSAAAPTRPTQSKPAPKSSRSPAKTFLDWESDTTTIYSYQNEIGETLFEVARAGRGSAKSISQRRPDGRGGYVYGLGAGLYEPSTRNSETAWYPVKAKNKPTNKAKEFPETRRVLYRLSEVLNAQFVFICEGEFAAESLNIALKAAGLFGEYVATTAPHGAGKWKGEFAEVLAGKTVIVLPDNDKQGSSHADAVCASCYKASAVVKRVELPELPEKGDVADFLSNGGSVEKIIELLEVTPNWCNRSNPCNPSNEVTGHNALDLLATDFPEPRWIATGIIPEGLSIFGGHPKLGKSWAMLSLAVAVACGGYAFGQIEVESGDVLYLAMEDTARRMKSRLLKQLAGERPEGLHRLHIEYLWPRINEGGLVALDKWLSEHPEARLVVIDTLQKIKPRRGGGGNVYESDSDDVGDLKSLSDKYAVAIICVHHLRKGDGDDPVEQLSGSYGISGAADTLLILQRTRGQADATLYAVGRDVDETTHALKFDKEFAQWNLLGDAAEYTLTSGRQEVLEALRTMPESVTPTQLWERAQVGKSLTNLKTLLWRMSKDGEVESGAGKYWVTPVTRVTRDTPVTPVTRNGRKKATNSADDEPYTVAPVAQPVNDERDIFDDVDDTNTEGTN